MIITAEDLYARHLQAREALSEHSIDVIARLSSGIKSKKLVRKFNVMSNWVSYMNDFIKAPKNIISKSPSSIIIGDITAPLRFPVTLGIESLEGEFTVISYINSYSESTWRNDLLSNVTPGFSISNSYKVSFPKTAKYNGQTLKLSPKAVASLGGVVSGGVSSSSFSNISEEKKKMFNTVLEKIAIELKITYKSYKEININKMLNNLSSDITTASIALLNGDGVVLTDENNTPLEL
jgi:hypothetical protein